jgi:hypothetical protein
MKQRADPAPVISARMEDNRQEKLAELRERAAEVAAIVVRLPADRSLVPGSEARAELLHRFGLTAAMSAEWMTDPVAFVAEVTDHYALWFGKDGPSWIRDEHYCPGRDEVMQIAAEELERARTGRHTSGGRAARNRSLRARLAPPDGAPRWRPQA